MSEWETSAHRSHPNFRNKSLLIYAAPVHDSIMSFSRAFVLLSVVALLLLLYIGQSGGANNLRSRLVPPSPPVFDWKLASTEGIALDAAVMRGWRIQSRGERVRLMVLSDSAVAFGFMPEDMMQHVHSAADVNFPALDCSRVDVFRAEAECELSQGEHELLLRDSRDAGNAAVALGALLFGQSKPMAEMTQKNKVTVNFY